MQEGQRKPPPDARQASSHERLQISRASATNTASLGPAHSSKVIPTLVAAQCYEEDTPRRNVSQAGEILPPTSRKKQFPRGLKRLRDRLQVLDDRLRLDVNALKQQISDLQLHSTLLATKIRVQQPTSQPEPMSLIRNAVETVVEYFGAFQFGWILPLDSADERGSVWMQPRITVQTMIEGEEESKLTFDQRRVDETLQCERHRLLVGRQGHFMSTALSPAMQVAGRRDGVSVFELKWKNFTRRHATTRLDLISMSSHGSHHEPIVIALGSWSGYMTLVLLREIYPAVLADSQLVKRLVGAHIQYPSREVFHFDAEGHVIYYDVTLDLVVALQRVVGNLRGVTRLLDAAAVNRRGG